MRGGGNDDDDEVLNKCIMDMYVLYVDGREVQRERDGSDRCKGVTVHMPLWRLIFTLPLSFVPSIVDRFVTM